MDSHFVSDNIFGGTLPKCVCCIRDKLIKFVKSLVLLDGTWEAKLVPCNLMVL